MGKKPNPHEQPNVPSCQRPQVQHVLPTPSQVSFLDVAGYEVKEMPLAAPALREQEGIGIAG